MSFPNPRKTEPVQIFKKHSDKISSFPASSQRIASETETTPVTPHNQEDDEFGKFEENF